MGFTEWIRVAAIIMPILKAGIILVTSHLYFNAEQMYNMEII
jgi:hypothetical protein